MSRMVHISAPWHLPVRRYESRKSVFEAKKECIYTLVYQGLIERGGGAPCDFLNALYHLYTFEWETGIHTHNSSLEGAMKPTLESFYSA